MSKVSSLAALTSAQPDDVIPIVDVHDPTMAVTGTTKKISVTNLLAGALPTLAQASASASATLALNTITTVTAATALTMTLPTAATGSLIVVERASASTANVAVTGSIRGVGAQTVTLQLSNESETFFATGGSWWPVAGHKTLGSLDSRYVPGIFAVKTYGAVGNTKAVADGAMTASSATLTSATAGFTAADVGKSVIVTGAGPAGAALGTTVSAYVNSTTVTLAASASTTVSGAPLTWGTDDTAAIKAAVAAAVAAGGGVVWVAPGMNCLVSQLILLASGVELVGAGRFSSTITANASALITAWQTSGGWPVIVGAVNATGCGVRDLGVNASGTMTSGVCMLGGTGVYIRDCFIQGAAGHSGAHFFGTQNTGVGPVMYGVMAGNIVAASLYNCVFDGECVSCVMDGNVSHDALAGHFSMGGLSGLAATPGSGNVVSGNSGHGGGSTSQNFYGGIYIENNNDATVTGNVITGYAGYATLNIRGASGTFTGNRLTGNISSLPLYALRLNSGNGVLDIAGNTFANASTGILSTSGGNQFARVRDNDFVNVAILRSGSIPAASDWSGNRQLDSSYALLTPNVTPATGPSAFLCAPNSYAPASQAVLSTTSATLTAVSSGNACTGNFFAPVSGIVVVTASLVAVVNAGVHCSFGLAASGAVSPVAGNVVTYSGSSSTGPPLTMTFVVTGLTPGTVYNFDLLFAVAGADTLSVLALGANSTTPTGTGGAPVTMTVQAV
jgi:hypothetical protein